MDKQTQKNLLNLVKRNYEEIAEDFDITRQKKLWPELIKLAGLVKDGDRVLDVGCGNGRLVEAFRDKKIEYLGVDSSEKLIETANKNFQFSIFNFQTNPNFQFSNKIPRSQVRDKQNTKFIIGDILELDKLPENNFNYVFCIAVLHHLPGDGLRLQALEQIKHKLAPNGKIILTVWNLWSQPKFRKLIFKTFLEKMLRNLGLMSRRCGRDPDFALRTSGSWGDILFDWKNSAGQPMNRRYYHAFNQSEIKKIVEKAGLRLEKLYYDKYNYYLILGK